ncbi:MAG: sulfurtransferase [Chloroflexi bacterium]|nr:sulfurtransferase [Chloroflexota bacterium]
MFHITWCKITSMPNATIPSPLVTVQWLADNFNAENLVILDASMTPITSAGYEAFESRTFIKGARRFDFDNDIREKNTSLPHMMPTAEYFTGEMQKLGINNDSAIVAYDHVGVYSSPRVWWMFRAMGHDQVAVLDGGLPAWIKAGLPCGDVAEKIASTRGNFVARPQTGFFSNSNDVLTAISDPRYAVIDARSDGRFKGAEPEPRPGLRSGHIPNSISLPFANVVAEGFILPKTKLESIFAKLVNKEQNLIFSCGSGVTSCVDALAAGLAGYPSISVYDGSWSEWGLESSGLPVTKD